MPRIPTGEGKSRLNLEVSARTRMRLEQLRMLTEADTLVEVVRRALQAYEILWLALRNGKTLIVRSPDGTEEKILLA